MPSPSTFRAGIAPSKSPDNLRNGKSEPVSSRTRGLDPTVMILAVLWPVMGVLGAAHFGGMAASRNPLEPVGCVDPNVAPWWELTVLPRIGSTTAHRVVAYRETVRTARHDSDETPAFEQVADLARVPGIGPKTLQRISPYLCIRRD